MKCNYQGRLSITEEKQRQEKYRKIINNIYKDNYMKKRLQKYNFKDFSDTYKDISIINQLERFTDLCIKSEMKNGLIIYGNMIFFNFLRFLSTLI